MNLFKKTIYAFCVIALLASCDDDDDDDDNVTTNDLYTNTLVTFTDEVAVPTYADLKEKSQAMLDAMNKFSTTPNQANLKATADAWRATRIPWEASEGFLFGPVDYRGVDPRIDSWPLNQAELDRVLGQ